MKRSRASPDRVARVFHGCAEQLGCGRNDCRVVWAGALEPDGRQPPVKLLYGRREDRLRAVYRLRHGSRLKRSDVIVQTCGSPMCVDRRHLRLAPAALSPNPVSHSTPGARNP